METECGVDRISSLPLPLLHHILSSLTPQAMVQTCILSKRWSNVWCSVAFLDFDEKLFSRKSTFVQFVESLLFLRDGSHINKFRVYLDCKHDDTEVNKWVIYAVRHNVQVLDADLYKQNELTLHVFTSESLREFKLSNTRLNVPASIHLPALQVLHLSGVILHDGQLDEALVSAAMPSLKTFILEDCYFANQEVFRISASQLENLTVKGLCPTAVEISAPNLVSFEIKPEQKLPEIVRFKSNPILLLHASLDLGASRFESMIQLFMMLRSTRSLALSSLFLSSVVAELQKDFGIAECIRTPFNNLKCLKFGTSFTDAELLVINTILEQSPYLETIYLENETGKNDCCMKAGEHFEEVKLWLSHNLAHLKLVEVQGFRGSENEVKFVKFFLENAVVLDKLIITTSKSDSGNSQEVVKIGRKLLSCARASSSVGILFTSFLPFI